jgi:hypothetical protein
MQLQAIQYWLLAFALVCGSLAVVVHLGERRLGRYLSESEGKGAADRPGSSAYFYEYLNSRTNLSAQAAILVALAAALLLGYGIVYVLASNLLLVVLVIAAAYVIFLNVDSIEGLLFLRFLSKTSPEKAGRWELGFGRWAVAAMRRGRAGFTARAVLMVALIPAATQAVGALEWGVALYIGGVYAAASALPLGPGISSVVIVLAYILTFVGGNVVLAKVVSALRRRRGTSPPR